MLRNLSELDGLRLVNLFCIDGTIQDKAVIVYTGNGIDEIYLVGVVNFVCGLELFLVRVFRVGTSSREGVFCGFLCLPELADQGPGFYRPKIFAEIFKHLVLKLSPFNQLVFVQYDLALEVDFVAERLLSFIQHFRVVSDFNFYAIPNFHSCFGRPGTPLLLQMLVESLRLSLWQSLQV